MRWRRVVVLLMLLLGLLVYRMVESPTDLVHTEPLPLEPPPAEPTSEQVHQLCGACHAYPPPDSLPRSVWREEIKKAYGFIHDSELPLDLLNLEGVAGYYERRAPEELPPLELGTAASQPIRRQFQRVVAGVAPDRTSSVVTNFQLAHLFSTRGLDLLVCQHNPGQIWAVRFDQLTPSWKLLGTALAPAHVEVIDLDRDGHQDLLVADLGRLPPTDDRVGQVLWFRNDGHNHFTARPLLDGVGRVADVQATDFNRDGRIDLVVAVFGWHSTGEVLYLENQTTDWSTPTFRSTILDSRPGAIHVPIGDINSDGKPDIVALLSQGAETLVAYLGEGDGTFRRETLYTAPHPTYGSSGIQLVDLDSDGDLDVLFTNGDILDPPFLLKPYHGVQWLENRDGSFPFTHHPLAPLYGAMRAVAADVDADGDQDVFAVSFLPMERFPQRTQLSPTSVLFLEQTERGKFRRSELESEQCDHVTCVAGDLDGDGRIHLVTGNFLMTPASWRDESITVWRNLGSHSAVKN